MKSLLQQRIIISLSLALIAVLIAVTPERTKPASITSTSNNMTMSNQQTWVVCPQGPPVCRFTQIQDAIDAAPEGTVIAIKTGTYEENLIVRKSLTIQAAEGEQVVIKSPVERFPTLLLVSGWYPIHVEIDGLTFQPARPQEGNGIEILGMVAARLERNTLDDYEFAILVVGKEAERGPSKLPVVITENTIHSSIGIRSSVSVEISKNSLRPKAAEATVSELGISIEASGDIMVLENLLEGGAVWISHSLDVDIERNIIRSGFGIYIEKISRFVTLSGNQIEQNAWGVAVTRGSLVKLSGNRIVQQELYGLVVESPEDIILCEKNHIRDNKQDDYRVQSPLIGNSKRDPAAEEKLRQQCERG